jgi:phosphonate transport system ATP-binding protein
MVMETLKKLNQEENLTVVISLHQIDYALRYCRRVVALSCGLILYDGPSRDLTADKIKGIYGLSAASMFEGSAWTEDRTKPGITPQPPLERLAERLYNA